MDEGEQYGASLLFRQVISWLSRSPLRLRCL